MRHGSRLGRGRHRRRLLAAHCLAVLVPLLGGVASADDAAVLPKGRARGTLEVLQYFTITERYGPDGKAEPIAVDYNRRLDSSVFTLLAPLDPFVGRASIGDSVVSFEYDFTILDLGAQYGVTDRLTLGVRIPYWWWKNTVDARVESGPGSSANVGFNPRAGQPGQPPIIPLALGGRPLSTEDVQQLLGPGVGGIPGFGFKRVETRSDNGLGDIEAGGRYQYLRTRDWQLAFTGGVRFPTGKVEDPDDLVDYGIGSGAYALLFQFNQDYYLSNLWKGEQSRGFEGVPGAMAPGDLVLNGTFRYDLVLPDHEVKRVPDDVNNPITVNKEKVSRDLGDIFELEASARYAVFKGWSLSGLYRYRFKLKDSVSGSRGFAYESLERETDYTEHVFIVGVAYSTLPLVLEGRFPVPITVSLGYRNRFAGSNNTFKSEYIVFGLSGIF